MNKHLQPIDASTPASLPPAGESEHQLVAALRRGDEAAFIALVERFHYSLLRLARSYGVDSAVAEEIVQETWMALVTGIERFEARSSVKTWLFRVLAYQAGRRARREARFVPFSDLTSPTVDQDRFEPSGGRWAGHWADRIPTWDDAPEERLLARETRDTIDRLIAQLPDRQRQVILLRDVEGVSAADTCAILEIPDHVQRLLLHRARARVRSGLDRYLRGIEGTTG